MQEAGVKGYEMSYWTAVYLPRNAPPDITAQLSRLLGKAMNSQELKQLTEKTGTEVAFGDGEALKQFQASETEKWARIIKAAGIKPE